eukprot:SM000016S01935  [mRNA]  locus=s16:775916:782349:+ [translate_table: standard]
MMSGKSMSATSKRKFVTPRLSESRVCKSDGTQTPAYGLPEDCVPGTRHLIKEPPATATYYSIMFCKKKKHAKHKGPWSDGILILKGKSCILQDKGGKQLGKSSISGCEDMPSGATIEAGNYHVEVMDRVDEEAFTSGTVFLSWCSSSTCDDLGQANNTRPTTIFSRLTRNLHSGSCGLMLTFCRPTRPLAKTYQRPLPPKEGVHLLVEGTESSSPVWLDQFFVQTLRPHQLDGVKFMLECVTGLRVSSFRGCLLADEMGLGKTLQVLALIWTLLKQATSRIEIFRNGYVCPLLIISYELLRKHADTISKAQPGLLVCDEGHRLKNAQGSKTISALTSLECPRRILLTGTPVQNDLNELYAMVDFVNPNLLGPLPAFRRLYTDPIERSRDRDASVEEQLLGKHRSEKLQHMINACMLRRTASVLAQHLPPKNEYVVFCKLHPLQIELYKRYLQSKTVVSLINGSGDSTNPLVAIATLRKVCNHPKLLSSEEAEQGGPLAALTNQTKTSVRLHGALHEAMITGTSDMYVVDHYRLLLIKLKSRVMATAVVQLVNLTRSPARWPASPACCTIWPVVLLLEKRRGWSLYLTLRRLLTFFRLDGSTDVSDRQPMVDRFNAGTFNEMVFLLSSKAGGAGLNLVGANRLVMFDPDWNPATDAQAMGRIWRDGQRRPVVIYRMLVTGSIEEKIYQRQMIKGEVAAAVAGSDAGRHSISERHFSREELKEIFTLRQDTSCDTYDLLQKASIPHHQQWKDCSPSLSDGPLLEAKRLGLITYIQHIEHGAFPSTLHNKVGVCKKNQEPIIAGSCAANEIIDNLPQETWPVATGLAVGFSSTVDSGAETAAHTK